MFAALFRDANRIKAINYVIESCERQICTEQARMYKLNELSETRPSSNEWQAFYDKRDLQQDVIDALKLVRETLPAPILTGKKQLRQRDLQTHLHAVLPYASIFLNTTEDLAQRELFRLAYCCINDQLNHTQWEQGTQSSSSDVGLDIMDQHPSTDNVRIVSTSDQLDVPDFMKPEFTPAG